MPLLPCLSHQDCQRDSIMHIMWHHGLHTGILTRMYHQPTAAGPGCGWT
jgi:hypothetical protein